MAKVRHSPRRAKAAGQNAGRPSALTGRCGTIWRLAVSTTATPTAGAQRPPKEGLAVPAATDVAARSPTQATSRRDTALDYLRAFVIVLVVAVHSVAAYALVIPASHPRHSWRADRRQPPHARRRPVSAFQRQ